jgi:methylthioribose-1-phosphate isomerase
VTVDQVANDMFPLANAGQRVVLEGIGVWNPSFDVAPAPLIEGIVTEKGLVPKDAKSSSFRVQEFMQELGLWQGSKKQKTGT